MTFDKWFSTFLEEKNLPFKSWEIVDKNGETNFIDSDVVIEAIGNTSDAEKKAIKHSIVKIDFYNGDVNHFFEHLATGLVNARLS